MKLNQTVLFILSFLLVVSVSAVYATSGSEPVVPAPGDYWVALTHPQSAEESGQITESHSLIQFKNTDVQVSAYKRQGRIKRLFGSAFSSGASPEISAEAFLQSNAGLFGVDITDLTDRYLQPIMYERDTGRYKFTAVCYSQSKDGIPVFGSRLILLERNEAGYPLVLVSSDLRNLGGFTPQMGQDRMNPSAGITNARSLSPSLVNFTEPELVIWAGVDDIMVEPVIVYSFIGDNGHPADGSNPERYLFVTDAATGEIFYIENLIIFVDVQGSVQGKATQGKGADYCEEELPEPMPWARVNIGSTVAYADSNGDFVISNSGSSPVTVESRLRGMWFTVTNQAGSNSVLYDTVTPPGPANFMHNDPNTSEFVRAEVNGYLQANVVRDFTLRYNPSYPGLQQSEFPVKVNATGGYCPGNAWYDGSSITFCRTGSGYPNTAWSTVIHHEYGHHLVAMAGSGQNEYGEGMGDVMGVLILDDPGTGYGFEGNCSVPLRNANNTLQYPCSGEIHYCGQLLSGCVWSTRNQLLITNPGTYRDIISSLAVNAMLLHTGGGIAPSITIDYLTLDDDNGNIYDGTPHYNEIDAGFSAHNMDAPEMALLSYSFPNGLPELISPSGGTTARVVVNGVMAQPKPNTGVMFFNDGSGWNPIPMTAIDSNTYDAVFPPEECGTQVSFYFRTQTTDGRYQFYPSDAPSVVLFAISAWVPLNGGILVVDETYINSAYNMVNSDSINAFYNRALQDYTFAYVDRSCPNCYPQNQLHLEELVCYTSIIVHSEDNRGNRSLGATDDSTYYALKKYLSYGGKVIIEGRRNFSRGNDGESAIRVFSPGEIPYDYLKVRSAYVPIWSPADRSEEFIGAQSQVSGYPALQVDSLRVAQCSFGGLELLGRVPGVGYIDSLRAGEVIYDFHSTYDTSHSEGKPIAYRYLDVDYKVIYFDFPLYFIQEAQATELLHQALSDLGVLPFLCGDCDASSVVDLGDVAYLINYVYKNGFPPKPMRAGDVNLDTVVELGDIVYLINYLYKDGNPLCKP